MTSLAVVLALGVVAPQGTAEKVIISFMDDDFDNLEMIPQSKDHAIVNKKLKAFHDFVRNAKTSKHPRKRLFYKNVAYRNIQLSYEKIMKDAIEKMKDFNEYRKSKVAEGRSNSFGAKRKTRGEASEVADDDDDDDDDDEDYYDDGYRVNADRAPNFSNELYHLKYEAQVNESEANKKVFKYSDEGKPEENARDAFKKIIDVKTPKNCTEYTGYGIQYIECLMELHKHGEMSGRKALGKFIKVVFVWIGIYLVIAIPLWCIKGWGCCCFRCEVCRPRKVVKEIQRYIAENPPGVYVNEDGEEEHYAPTNTERQLYEKINKSILHM